MSTPEISIVMPARNEATALVGLLPALRARFPQAEILVVDDGSTDDTASLCEQHQVRCLRRPYSMGNGAAIKHGARHARGDLIVFMDADGQHRPEHVAQLLSRFHDSDLDMLVGARPWSAQAGILRGVGNRVFNWLASWVTGHRIPDLTSGLRVVKAERFREFLHLLPNGFSYPTTSTMAFFRSGYAVDYEPVDVQPRIGNSHLNIWKEGGRFLLIIFRIGVMYSPMKLFAPASLGLFLAASLLYAYNFFTQGRFTNMSALLYMTSLLTFLIGLLSEQINGLMYARRADKDAD
jgi:glycosyltransferase involved in cell wall biosynthesis